MNIGKMLMRRRLMADSTPFEEDRWFAFRMIPCEVRRGLKITDKLFASPLCELTGSYAHGKVTFRTTGEMRACADGLYSVTPDGSGQTGDAIYLWSEVLPGYADTVCLICSAPAVVYGKQNEYPDFGFKDGYLYIHAREETTND